MTGFMLRLYPVAQAQDVRVIEVLQVVERGQGHMIRDLGS